MSLLDFLFPKYCINCKALGSYLCAKCFSYVSFTESDFCVVCQRQAIGGVTHPVCRTKYSLDGTFSSLVYAGVVKKLVYQFKYPPHITKLQDLLGEFFYDGIIQKEQFYRLLQENALFVPIPLHSSKLRRRGYNQSFLLAKHLATKCGSEVIDCLERVKNTGTQVGRTQKEREANIKDAFQLRKGYEAQIYDVKQIFLIDDVVTSGATLKEAAKVLKKGGVGKVWGVTLAHG